MKRKNRNKALLAITTILTITVLTSCGGQSKSKQHAADVTLHTQNDTLNWVMGENMAIGLQSSGLTLNPELIAQAFLATMNNETQPISDTTYEQAVAYINAMIVAKQRQQRQEQVNTAKATEQQYFDKLLQDNKSIQKSDKGFYYEVLQKGHGPNAKPNEVVTFDYKAFFTNGQLFDQTYGNRDAITHVLGNPMFQGLQDALCLMNEGAKYRFYFPYETAFGTQGADDIPPCTTMIYEVELHAIK